MSGCVSGLSGLEATLYWLFWSPWPTVMISAPWSAMSGPVLTAAALPTTPWFAVTCETELAVPVPPTGVMNRPTSSKYPSCTAT